MPYDKYRNWPLPGKEGMPAPGRPLGARRMSLEELVLKDLAEAKDDVDKLEILDSYAAYAQRVYRQDFADSAAVQAGYTLGKLLEPIFLSRLPSVACYGRSRVVACEPGSYNKKPEI
jgi:hypothetical protein